MLSKSGVLSSLKKKVYNMFHIGTIKRRLVAWSLIIIFVSLIALFFSFHILFNKYKLKNYEEYTINSFNQTKKYFNAYIENLDVHINKIILNNDLVSDFTQKINYTDSKITYDTITELDSTLNHIFFNQNYIDNIIILGQNNFPYIYSWGVSGKYGGDNFSFYDFIKTNNLQTLKKNDSILMYNESNSKNAIKADLTNIQEAIEDKLLYISSIRSNDTHIESVIIFCINPDFLTNILSANALSTTFLIDSDNSLIYSSNKAVDYTSLNQNDVIKDETIESKDGYLITQFTVDYYDFKFLRYSPIENILGDTDSIKSVLIFYGVVLILFIYTIALGFSNHITKPLHRLCNKLSIADSIPDKITIISNKSNRYNLKIKLFFYFIMSTLLPVLIYAIILFVHYYSNYNDYITELATKNMYQAEKNINSRLEAFDEFTIDITYNDTIQNLLYEQYEKDEMSYNDYLIDKLIADIKYTDQEFASLKLYDTYGQIAYSSIFFEHSRKDFLETSLIKKANDSLGELLFVNSKSYNKKPTLSYLRLVKSKRANLFSKTIGYVLFYTEQEMLNNIISDIHFERSGYIFLMDKNGHVLNHYYNSLTNNIMSSNTAFDQFKMAKSGVFKTSYDHENYLVIYNTSSIHQLKVIAVIPYSELSKKFIPVILLCLTIIITCSIAIFIISTLISYQIIRPLNHLKTLMDQVSDNNLDIHMQYQKNDEIGVLTQQFNYMIDRLNKLIYESYQTKLKQQELMFLEKEAQLNALQQQINPHFLYNTLESINWMAYKIGAHHICDMVTALGDFFRGSITKSKEFITFNEEIEHLKNYIYIQQIRYQGRFKVTWNIDNTILDHKTVKLILQPIVENAILHGIDSLESDGALEIQGYKSDDKIVFHIKDNGAGMTEDALSMLKEKLFDSETNDKGVGIYNVYRRLNLYFQEKFSFDIVSQEQKGTIVSFSIPAFK